MFYQITNTMLELMTDEERKEQETNKNLKQIKQKDNKNKKRNIKLFKSRVEELDEEN